MAKDNKYLKPILATFGAIALILGGSAIFGTKDKAEEGVSVSVSDDGKENSAGDTASKSGSDDKAAVSEKTATKLTVLASKCRGCGRCVRIDPEHFALDVENRVAIVISTDNLDSEELQLAANNCEEGAIIIS
jgi:ferredoxin